VIVYLAHENRCVNVLFGSVFGGFAVGTQNTVHLVEDTFRKARFHDFVVGLPGDGPGDLPQPYRLTLGRVSHEAKPR